MATVLSVTTCLRPGQCPLWGLFGVLVSTQLFGYFSVEHLSLGEI